MLVLLSVSSIVFVLLLRAACSLYLSRRFASHEGTDGQVFAASGYRLGYHLQRPEGPSKGLILLIHGANSGKATMDFLLAEALLEEGFSTLSVDRPGAGESRLWAHNETIHDPRGAALLIRALLEHLDLATEDVLVLGYSMGATVALALGSLAPAQTRGIVALAGVAAPYVSTRNLYDLLLVPVVGVMVRFLYPILAVTVGLRTIASLKPRGGAWSDVDLARSGLAGGLLDANTIHGSTLSRRTNALALSSLLPALRAAELPTLILWPEHEQVVHPRHRDTLAGLHKKSLVRSLDDTDHYCPFFPSSAYRIAEEVNEVFEAGFFEAGWHA